MVNVLMSSSVFATALCALLPLTSATTCIAKTVEQTDEKAGASLTPLFGVPASPAPAPVLAPGDETWTMPKVVAQPNWGAHIQRSMKLMASSTRNHRNRVRVLFYGQSITEQNWTKSVSDDLRRRFPFTDFEIENRAIGGFASQLLVKSAEEDLYPFYPDLLIFHAYGSHIDYEKIIENTRRRTTADILIQTDHITKSEDLNEETDSARLSPANWSAWFNHVFLPQTALKYDTELANIHAQWKAYLKTENIEPQQFLADGVHLNNRGNALMATFISPYLRYDPQLPVINADSVRTYAIGTNLKWNKGKLKMEFVGNRVDVIADNAKTSSTKNDGAFKVLIDGKAPSQLMGTTAFTRSSIGFATWTPAITRFSSQALLVPETWTAKITEVSADGKKFRYNVRGSVTGDDGSGNSEAIFVSKSKRVVIDPADWWLGFSSAPMPLGFEVTWQSVSQYVDVYTSPQPDKSNIEYSNSEHSTTLAQGFSNEKHTLELVAVGKTAPALKALRIYKPPLK